MTITPGPRRLVGVADDYNRALDQLERRSVRNTRELLRRSLANTLESLRRSYALYLESLGPMSRDPSGQFVRRPGSYTTAEATAKFRAILRDAQSFLPPFELEQWQVRYQADLREATTLGVELAAELSRLQQLPTPAGPDIGPTTPGEVRALGQELLQMVTRPDSQSPFAGVNPEVVRAAALQASAMIQGETARFRDQIVQIVGEAASRGWGPKRLERDIRRALEGARDPNGITQRLGLRQRAELIARSELAAAYSAGTIRRAQQRGVAYIQVLASNDERVCPTCASRNGRVYPVDRIVLPFHPRCVLGDTHVSPGLLAAVIRSWYRGDVVTVGLENGERLTITANHPVLTPSGWVKAEALREGDQLVGQWLHDAEGLVAPDPDLHQMPATAEEVFAALAKSGSVTTVSVPVAPLDLHGDGAFIEGNVDVVRANSLLECYRDTFILNGVGDSEGLNGSVRFRPFASLSHADAGLLWHAATAAGSVSRLREAQALFRGGLSHAEQHRIAAAAWRDPVLAQEGSDGVSLNAEALGYGLDTGAVLECPQCGSLVKDGPAGHDDASSLDVAPDDVGGNAVSSADHLGGHPGLVKLHKVVSVEINPFHGFVYTFETFSGTYSIGADVRILTQNCRCVGVEVNNEAVTETDPELRATLLDSERWQEEHERGVKAYAEGRHQERIDTLRRQIDRAADGDRKDALSAELQRLVDRGPDMVKARAELAQALRTPTASERRLFGKGTQTLRESVPLFGTSASPPKQEPSTAERVASKGDSVVRKYAPSLIAYESLQRRNNLIRNQLLDRLAVASDPKQSQKLERQYLRLSQIMVNARTKAAQSLGELRKQMLKTKLDSYDVKTVVNGVSYIEHGAPELKEVKKAVTEYVRMFNGKGIGGTQNGVVGVGVIGADERGFSMPGTGRIKVRASSKGNIFHEITHVVENQNPWMSEWAKEWASSRAYDESHESIRDGIYNRLQGKAISSERGKPLFELSEIMPNHGYGPGETAWVDKYVNPYMGKVYRNREGYPSSTEVWTMAVEHFESQQSMLRLYEAHPDLFKMVVGLSTE